MRRRNTWVEPTERQTASAWHDQTQEGNKDTCGEQNAPKQSEAKRGSHGRDVNADLQHVLTKEDTNSIQTKIPRPGGIPAIPAPSITWHGWFIYGCWGGTVQLGSWKFLGAEFWKSTLLDNSPFARLLRLAPMLNPSRNTRSQLLTLCCAGRVGGKGISNRTFHQLCWTAMQLADLSFGFKLFLLTRSSHISFVHRRTLFKGLRHYSWTVTGWDMTSQKTIVSPKAGPQSCQDQWWTHSGSCPRHRRRWRSTRAKRSPCSSRRY